MCVPIFQGLSVKWKEVSPYVKMFGNECVIVQEAARIHDAYHWCLCHSDAWFVNTKSVSSKCLTSCNFYSVSIEKKRFCLVKKAGSSWVNRKRMSESSKRNYSVSFYGELKKEKWTMFYKIWSRDIQLLSNTFMPVIFIIGKKASF